MKQFLLLFAFIACGTIAAQAQCGHAAKTSSAAVETAAVDNNVVLAALEADDSVEKRVCAKSGTVSYARKSVCATSGKVSYSDVEYCTKSAKFVNVSPSEKAACAKKCSKGKAMSTSSKAACSKTAGSKKACAKDAKSGACCKSKAGAKASSASAANEVRATKVNAKH